MFLSTLLSRSYWFLSILLSRSYWFRGFRFHPVQSSRNFLTHKTFVKTKILSYISTHIHFQYIVIVSRDLKNQKVAPHPPPTTHLPLNKTKIFGVESNILLKYKRIKWTPVGHKLRLFPLRGIKPFVPSNNVQTILKQLQKNYWGLS